MKTFLMSFGYVGLRRIVDADGNQVRLSPSGVVLSRTLADVLDVTGDHPEIYANAGWEALTWVPDSFLVAQRFFHVRPLYDANKVIVFVHHGHRVEGVAIE